MGARGAFCVHVTGFAELCPESSVPVEAREESGSSTAGVGSAGEFGQVSMFWQDVLRYWPQASLVCAHHDG